MHDGRCETCGAVLVNGRCPVYYGHTGSSLDNDTCPLCGSRLWKGTCWRHGDIATAALDVEHQLLLLVEAVRS